jgi:hypothetical protein
MTKKIILIIIALLIASCVKTPNNNDLLKRLDDNSVNIDELPDWIIANEDENGITGIGISAFRGGGLRMQIRQAEVDAKAEIASKIESSISRVTKEALQESDINKINDVAQFFSQATKQVVKERSLSGVVRTHLFIDRDKNLYVRMLLTNKNYLQYLENSEKIYEQRLKRSRLPDKNISFAQDAVKGLFEELEKERLK